jgi:hypothetical protein
MKELSYCTYLAVVLKYILIYTLQRFVSIFEREEIALICGGFIRLPIERTLVGTCIPPMQILVGFLVNVTGSLDRGRRVRNNFPAQCAGTENPHSTSRISLLTVPLLYFLSHPFSQSSYLHLPATMQLALLRGSLEYLQVLGGLGTSLNQIHIV